MNHKFQSLILKLACALLLMPAATIVQAKSNASMKVEPGMYKIKSGTKIPLKGPVIKVYAEGSSTKYSHVADTHKTRPVLVKYVASCSNKGKLSGGSVSIGDAKTSIKKGSGFSSDSVWINVPYQKMAHIDPIKLCNDHAKTLSLEKDRPLEKIIQKGFPMKIPNVLSAKGTAYCQAAGLGKGGVKSDTTNGLGVFLQCEKNPKARAPRKSTKTTKAGRPDPGKATTIFKGGSLRAATPSYVGKCPASMKFNGTITATGKGKIEYQIIGDGNYKTPVKTINFSEAGTQKFQWTRMVRKPEANSRLAIPGEKPDPNLIQGWMQLKVTYKLGNKIASTKKVWHSKRQDFSVRCGSAAQILRKAN